MVTRVVPHQALETSHRAPETAPAPVSDPAVVGVLDWWDAHGRALPWRTTRDTYAIWVAEVMSVQTTVLRAATAWERWLARWPTVEALAAASLSDVLGQWQGLGYPRRARDLHRSAQIVATGGWPVDMTELPGVGPYISAAVACFAHEAPVLPHDVNVNRVLARRFPSGIDTTGDPWRAGQALMEFGQRVCRARPVCAECPVTDGCGGPAASEAGISPARRQPPFEGSLRQRRGQLLAQVLAEGRVARAGADIEAGDGLARDGLVASDGLWLSAPG
jgi:A/G-specific adenine glycosylase